MTQELVSQYRICFNVYDTAIILYALTVRAFVYHSRFLHYPAACGVLHVVYRLYPINGATFKEIRYHRSQRLSSVTFSPPFTAELIPDGNAFDTLVIVYGFYCADKPFATLLDYRKN